MIFIEVFFPASEQREFSTSNIHIKLHIQASGTAKQQVEAEA
jgi:hypothetical protein